MIANLRELWPLDENIVYLNNGSYGAAPYEVIRERDRWGLELERGPCAYFRKLPERLAEVRSHVAAFVGADASRLALLTNATLGVNSVLGSLRFSERDEILLSSHGYPAVYASCMALSHRLGVKVVVAALPETIASHDDIVKAFAANITKQTRLIIADHVTSPTALIFPVEKLVALAKDAGVKILIDGAHAPGMLPLSLNTLGANFYTGNLHKWAFATKGAAFLYVDEEHVSDIRPLSTSYNYTLGFEKEFAWAGTADASALLAIPQALAFFKKLGGFEQSQRNHELVKEGAKIIAAELGSELLHPDSAEYHGSMATFLLPGRFEAPWNESSRVIGHFYDKHRIEVQSQPHGNRLTLRISAQAYNTVEDYEKLAAALAKRDFL